MAESIPRDAPGSIRLRALDGLRLVAALSVLVFHYTSRTQQAWGRDVHDVFPRLGGITQYGALGVYLFFLISGFVVLMSAWGRGVGAFAASRIARLYPAYLFAVIVTAAVIAWVPGADHGVPVQHLPIGDVALNLTMLQSFWGVSDVIGVAWTLGIELAFYLLLGVLVLIGITPNRVLAFAVLWPLTAAVAEATGVGFLARVLQPDFAPFFAAGMLLYLAYREGWSAPIVAGLAMNWLFMLHLASSYTVPWLQRVTEVRGSPVVIGILFTAMIGVIVACVFTPLGRVRRRWLTAAGFLTYPLYLMHELWGEWLIELLHPALPIPVTLAITAAAMLLLAYAVHRLIERPLGRRLRRGLETGFAALAARARRA